jgi:hypothetical protein
VKVEQQAGGAQQFRGYKGGDCVVTVLAVGSGSSDPAARARGVKSLEDIGGVVAIRR